MSTPTLVAEFESLRPRMLSLGYRLTGSVVDTCAAVSAAYTDPKAVDVEELTAAVIRQCHRRLVDTQQRRDRYVGPWLPEPVVADVDAPTADLLVSSLAASSVRLSDLVALDLLSPAQRVAHVAGTELSARRVADILNVAIDEVETLAGQSRSTIARSAQVDSIEEHNAVIGEAILALSTEDLDSLAPLVDPAVRYIGDSDGKATTARQVISGGTRVLRFLRGLMSRYGAELARHTRPVTVNGEIGLLTDSQPDPESLLAPRVTAFTVVDGRIVAVYDLANPEKLTGTPLFSPQRPTA